MTIRIVYIVENPEIGAAKLQFNTIPETLFDEKHLTRELLRSHGINLDLKSKEEIIKWVADKDVPKGLKYYLVDSVNFPLSNINRMDWYYDEASNSVKDS